MMKFPTVEGFKEVKGDQVATKRCYNTSLKTTSNSTTLIIGMVGARSKDEAKGGPTES
jgi:hypothetical protein